MTLSYLVKRFKGMISPSVFISSPPDDIIIQKNIRIGMRDKMEISINIFRPNDQSPHPVIMCFHPYGKDNLPKKGLFGYKPNLQYRLMRQTGDIKMSSLTSWEAPDPAFWVSHGYVVINADTRGFGKSGGEKSVLSDQEALDYYDLIEWAAIQPWSNGKVGLNGVSYLAISQYKVAALKPPHLAAICPWEGFSDFYQDLGRPGGIREDGFVVMWFKNVKLNDLRKKQSQHLLRDEFYKAFSADLKKITVPTLVCGSFSDHCLHTRGSYRVFNNISSTEKWLYTHRDGKWFSYYSQEALAFQLKFFDYFLHEQKNDLLSIPPVRLEVRENRTKISEVSYHSSWPIASTKWQPLYLNANSLELQLAPLANQTTTTFNSTDGCASFRWEIPNDLKIVGPMKLQLYIELESCNDINIFSGVRKFKDGLHVPFEGSYGFGLDIVSKGWLKASLRNLTLNPDRPWEIQHSFDRQELLEPRQIVCLEIELLPSATLFHKGDILRLDIQGHAFFKQSLLLSQVGSYENSLPGKCIIHCGNEYNSHLLIPVLLPK